MSGSCLSVGCSVRCGESLASDVRNVKCSLQVMKRYAVMKYVRLKHSFTSETQRK